MKQDIGGHASGAAGLTRGAVIACAATCGAMVANLYYAQPLVPVIGRALRLSPGAGGLIVTVTQLGYGAGLFLLVPLADRIENRRLIGITLLLTALALAGVALSPSRGLFFVACAALGIVSAGAQVVVPFAASLTPERARGRIIGDVMAGLLAGIMLARPVAGIAADLLSWRGAFGGAAVLTLAVAVWARAALPTRVPPAREPYPAILRSMGHMLLTTPPLRRRAIYQGLVFAVFNIFWTTVAIELGRHFGLGARGVALFALAGAAGALAAPVAGRLGDRGHVQAGTAGALATVLASCLLARWAGEARSLALLVLFAITLDAATQVNQVLGQRVIYTLPGEARGRLNAIYMTCVFLLGAAGSLIGTAAYAAGGWGESCLVAAGIAGLALALFATEFRR